MTDTVISVTGADPYDIVVGDGVLSGLADRLGQNVRKVLIHINNTNPILVEDGPERRMLAEHGIEVASDGMAFEL